MNNKTILAELHAKNEKAANEARETQAALVGFLKPRLGRLHTAGRSALIKMYGHERFAELKATDVPMEFGWLLSPRFSITRVTDTEIMIKTSKWGGVASETSEHKLSHSILQHSDRDYATMVRSKAKLLDSLVLDRKRAEAERAVTKLEQELVLAQIELSKLELSRLEDKVSKVRK